MEKFRGMNILFFFGLGQLITAILLNYTVAFWLPVENESRDLISYLANLHFVIGFISLPTGPLTDKEESPALESGAEIAKSILFGMFAYIILPFMLMRILIKNIKNNNHD